MNRVCKQAVVLDGSGFADTVKVEDIALVLFYVLFWLGLSSSIQK